MRLHRITFPDRACRCAALALTLASAVGCDGSPSGNTPAPRASASAPAPTPASASAAPSASAAKRNPRSERADRTYRAGRCGECHEKMYDEWETSAHAKADDSPVYVAMKKDGAAAGCDRCHAPLTLLNEPAAFAARESVSCEVCHRIESVEPTPPVPRMTLLAAHEVKFGPRCDPSEPYFHRARCSPIFEQSTVCGACHLLYHPAPDGGPPLPVHTEYADHETSPPAIRKKSCQSCHMPGTRAEVATAEREREDVPNHSFLGDAGKLRGTALDARAVATRKPDGVEVALVLKNARAGHSIPAGAPGRELVIEVVGRDAGGNDIARSEAAFGRQLVDAQGHAAPFYAAARVGSDTRIAAGETRRQTVALKDKSISELVVRVAFRSLGAALAERLKVKAPELDVVSETRIAVGQGTRSVELKR